MAKQKVAILGGGLGSLLSAYWLTESPGAAEKYEITVHQMGWRLGGKGASGRNLAPGFGKRIEEHGLHIWFGFYQNAFRSYRRILRQLAELPDPPVRTYTDWKDAFRPHSLVVLGDNGPEGLTQWPVLFPTNDRVPGSGKPPSDWEIFVDYLKLGRSFFDLHLPSSLVAELEGHLQGFQLPGWLSKIVGKAERSLLHLAHGIAELLSSELAGYVPGSRTILAEALAAFREGVRLTLGRRVPADAEARRIWVVVDLLTTIAIGALREDLFEKGFESADDVEFLTWLAHHGADPEVTLQSNIVGVLYDLVFAYEGGDTSRPNIGAGTGARIFLLVMGGFSGTVMYKMQSGMGDTIFTPLYGLLRHRGVKFEFFHRVDRLAVGESGAIDRIEIGRQVNLTPETIERGGYDPLVRVGELDVWPATPRFEQIVDGEKLRHDPHDPGYAYDLESRWTSWPDAGKVVLERGKHFDLVVLGIPVGALGEIAGELVDRSPTWKRMILGDGDAPPVATVRTQAAQLWFRKTTTELGWEAPRWMRDDPEHPEVSALLGGYLQPFNTWADMSQVLRTEEWPRGEDPRSVSYLCAQMRDDPDQAPYSDPSYPRTQRERARENARRWLDQAGQVLWPSVADPRSAFGLDPKSLVGPDGKDPFDEQYFRANIDPSERYVLSLAGTTKSRPPIHGPDFPNLYLAGDWVRNPVLNAGCVESTVASGMAAARAISGFPKEIEPDDVV